MEETIEVTVNVTEEDIERGRTQSMSECPVALALTRALNGLDDDIERVGVTTLVLEVETHDAYYTGDPPSRARQFVMEFDKGKTVEPITFDACLKEYSYQ